MPPRPTLRSNQEPASDFFAEDEVRDPPNVVVRSFTRHWKLVFLMVLAATALAWAFAAAQPRRYRTEAVASVSPIVSQLTQSELLHGIDALERRVVVATVAALVSSDMMKRRTVGALRGYEIDATVIPSTNLIRITVEGPDPKRVTAIANRIPPLLDEQTRAMYRVYTIATISAAVVPGASFQPRIVRIIIAGLVAGFVLGTAIAYLIDFIRSRRKGAAAPQ